MAPTGTTILGSLIRTQIIECEWEVFEQSNLCLLLLISNSLLNSCLFLSLFSFSVKYTPSFFWMHVSSSVAPFSSCPQSFPVSRSFPISRPFTSDSQSIHRQSFQWIVSADFLRDWLVWSPCSPRESKREPSYAVGGNAN